MGVWSIDMQSSMHSDATHKAGGYRVPIDECRKRCFVCFAHQGCFEPLFHTLDVAFYSTLHLVFSVLLQSNVLVDSRNRDNELAELSLDASVLREFAAGREAKLPILSRITNGQLLAIVNVIGQVHLDRLFLALHLPGPPNWSRSVKRIKDTIRDYGSFVKDEVFATNPNVPALHTQPVAGPEVAAASSSNSDSAAEIDLASIY